MTTSKSHDAIKDTESFIGRWHKHLISIENTCYNFCNFVRQVTSLGWKYEDFDVLADGNRQAENMSRKFYQLLIIFQKSLVKNEHNNVFPFSPYGSAFRDFNLKRRKSERMAIVIQNPDGTWLDFDRAKYGSGIINIGNSLSNNN